MEAEFEPGVAAVWTVDGVDGVDGVDEAVEVSNGGGPLGLAERAEHCRRTNSTPESGAMEVVASLERGKN